MYYTDNGRDVMITVLPCMYSTFGIHTCIESTLADLMNSAGSLLVDKSRQTDYRIKKGNEMKFAIAVERTDFTNIYLSDIVTSKLLKHNLQLVSLSLTRFLHFRAE